MYGRRTVSVLIGLALWSTTYATAQAELPADRVAEYSIRETPTDPESDVLYTITLELTAVNQDGDEIAWEITEVTVTEPAQGNSGKTVWVDDAPDPATQDGYWWVEHADPADPQDAEFDVPPPLERTAEAVDPSDDDMEYELAGAYCDAQCQQVYNSEGGALDYTLKLTNEEEPEVEEDDEPVQISGETEVS